MQCAVCVFPMEHSTVHSKNDLARVSANASRPSPCSPLLLDTPSSTRLKESSLVLVEVVVVVVVVLEWKVSKQSRVGRSVYSL